jgi:anti-sigma B factor antagonist
MQGRLTCEHGKGAGKRMELDIAAEHNEDVCALTLSGEVDVYTAPKLKETLVEEIESGCVRIIVDLDDVGFIDSSGLGVLVGGLRRAKERDGAIRLVCSRENVLKIFRITGLDKVFPIFSDMQEAREF